MSGEFGERIRRFRLARGFSQEELASLTGVSRNTVAGWETGHSRPDLGTVPRLCSALKVSVARFFGVEKQRSAREREVIDLFFALDPGDQDIILWQMEAIRQRRAEQKPAPAPAVVSLFRNDLGVAAGFGPALDTAAGCEVHVIKDRLTEQADEIITVSGRSMEPGFYDGDMVLVRHTDSVLPGEIGVFLVDNEGFIKQYQADGLHSLNPDYPVIRPDSWHDFRCIGKVLGKLEKDQIVD